MNASMNVQNVRWAVSIQSISGLRWGRFGQVGLDLGDGGLPVVEGDAVLAALGLEEQRVGLGDVAGVAGLLDGVELLRRTGPSAHLSSRVFLVGFGPSSCMVRLA